MSNSSLLLCHKCNKPIDFDAYHVSKTGKKIPLNPLTGQHHQCKVSSFIKCFACDEDITFNEKFVSKNGRRIPLELKEVGGELQIHKCVNKDLLTKGIPCRNCNETITFDDKVRSPKSGKLIPLLLSTFEPHECPTRG
jgi:hypothetical protein